MAASLRIEALTDGPNCASLGGMIHGPVWGEWVGWKRLCAAAGAVALLGACGSGSSGGTSGAGGNSSTGGAAGTTSGGAAGMNVGNAGASTGGESGAAGNAAGGSSGASTNAGTSGMNGDAGSAGVNGGGGVSGGGAGGEAGASGGEAGSRGDAGADECGGCDMGEQCIYQAGGPGPSRWLCAGFIACPQPCACVSEEQGTCTFVPGEGMPGYCSCDNGLD